jgi:hypothetical protein
VRFASCNETFWCGECTHIPILGQMTMISSASSLGCKFCHVLPFFVVDYNGESSMVCIDSNICQEQRFILVFTTTLLRMENVESLSKKLEG